MRGERIPLLARIGGSRVLGPRPGKAIVSFWQGIVEIVLRAIAVVSLKHLATYNTASHVD